MASVIALSFCWMANSPAISAQPSFNCFRAKLPDEFAICSNEVLASLDKIASRDYIYVRHLLGKRKANQINRPFIQARQACGGDERCLLATQISAIKAFGSHGAPEGFPIGVMDNFRSTSEMQELAAARATNDAKASQALQATQPVQAVQAVVTAQPVQVVQPMQGTEKPAEAAQFDGEAVVKLNVRLGQLGKEINLLKRVMEEQGKLLSNSAVENKTTVQKTIDALSSRVSGIETEYIEKDAKFSKYLTSIKPADKDQYITARKASLIYPKVPYYIPGTNEIGEFWVEPKVTDAGELMFNFRFIDPEAKNDTTRGSITMTGDQLKEVQQALFKLYGLSETAHENHIRENYSKRVSCFPSEQCPEEHAKGQIGKTSNELLFQVYEDGSTAGRFVENKGAFQDGFNVSVESALMLQAYLQHVLSQSASEFKAGTRTQQDLDKLFQ